MYDRVIDVPALARRLAQREMTMAELARRTGIAYSLIKYVRSGHRQFSDVTALKVANALGCTPEDISVPKRPTASGLAA